MRLFRYFVWTILLFLLFVESGFSAINMTVSPIKYELEVNPWSSITKTATLYNYDTVPVNIITAKSDFTSNGTTWGPSFVRYSELIHPDQQLSKWISLSSSGFTIPAAVWGKPSKKVINFTLNVPQNATPGWHYAAVFFNNNNSEVTSGTKVWINANYWVIILLKVSGEIITEIEIDEPVISNGGYSSASKKDYNLSNSKNLGYGASWIDNCLFDFTNSNFDGKCIDDPRDFVSKKKTELENRKNLNDDEIYEDKKENFKVWFTFPIKNKWNVHIKPTGKVKLIDEKGKQIKWVWKKARLNDLGAVIWVDIVDYLPINDGGGNVLPQSQRNFNESWKGFPYQTLDENGKIIMKDMSPEEYYTKQNIWGDRVLMPWERICYRKNNTTIKALIDLSYKNDKWEDVVYSSAKEIPISYTEKYIWINWYIVIPFFLIFGLLFLLWIIALWKRTRCINKDCKKRIKRKLARCPYCDTKQKKITKTKKIVKKPKEKVEKKAVTKKKKVTKKSKKK